MAVGLVTTANPALLGRRFTEGYLNQPNLMCDAALGPLRVIGTLNFEGYTLGRGELNAGMYGEGYADRRHPHTLVHEAMLTVATPVRAGFRATVVGGKGFTPYGTDDPMMRPLVKYPVNHHHAQVIERVQVIAAVQFARGDRAITLEQGWFNGDEPVGPFTGPQWSRVGDSRSTRLTVSLSHSLEWQASTAFVRSPGLTRGGAFDHRQVSSSLRYNVPSKRYALLEFARTDESLGSQRVFRPEGQRLLDLFRTANGHVDFQIVGITSWSIGTVQFAAPATRVPGLPRTRFTPFVEVARASARAQRTPAVFVPADFYGSNTQWLLSLGARVHAGSIRWRMGRYVRSASAGPSAFTSSHTHL